ncbi:MAG TPA: quinohemoprotein amine dehydrogenase maturation protein [Acidobacteriota bacterium]|nr:quinohemoprotein amine dehydrogenase maturation protein [Acidobacteriota bacterium]
MSVRSEVALSIGEYHAFEAAGRQYLYMVPSAAVFGLDETAAAVIEHLDGQPMAASELVEQLADRYAPEAVYHSVNELMQVRALGEADVAPQPLPRQMPPTPFPLTTLVLNVTNQCNLSCGYCYEYSEDKIVDTENGRQPKFMSEETAKQSVDFMLGKSAEIETVHLTFFGGETLMNFPVLKETVGYARQRAGQLGKGIEFNLTTNATLLRPDIIEWLADNEIGVTVSIDGPKEMQDELRVFKGGGGTYDIVVPKVRELLKRHTTRPIGARVTLTKNILDVKRIYRHLHDEVGFWEVGFAPVTTSWGQDWAIGDDGFDTMLAGFNELADEFLEAALDNRHHGFSNVKDTIEEIHKGVSKAYPCGAGLGLLGVATGGDVSLCHRFAGSDEHKIGTVDGGIDQSGQLHFLETHHVNDKTDCQKCWARPLCAGGCYHEAHTRYGTTRGPNLHYCEWIRAWTDTCLRVYGEIAEHNPGYLAIFEGRDQ